MDENTQEAQKPGDGQQLKSSAPAAGSVVLIAFVQGAAWWEYHQTRATMWQSDRRLAEEEAARRERDGTLGILPIDQYQARR